MMFVVSDIKLLANNMHTVYFSKHTMHGKLKYISYNMAAKAYSSDSSDLRKYMLARRLHLSHPLPRNKKPPHLP